MPWKDPEKKRTYYRERRAAQRAAARKKGVCIDCGAPALIERIKSADTNRVRRVTRNRCATHLAVQAQEAKARYEPRRQPE